MILRLGELKKGSMKSRLEEVMITQTMSSWKQHVLLLPIHRCYVLEIAIARVSASLPC